MRPDLAPDLQTPQRTSPVGALLGVFAVEQLRSFLPVVIVAASSGRFVIVLLLATIVGVVYNVASWWRRTWWFDGGVLHLDEGIVVRNERRIPVERIQHVELDQRLRHQAFGLSVVRVETAGGSGAELKLDAVSTARAEALRAGLVAGRAAATSATSTEPVSDAPTPPVESEVLVRLPPTRLLLAGITGPEVLAVLAALAVAFDVLADLGVDPGDVGRVELTALVVAGLVVVGVPAWFLVAGVIGVVRRWDLTATIRGDDLRVTYGLLRKSEFTVDLARVQDVRISHRFLLRPFGRADLRVRTAASGSSDRSRVDIPLLDGSERARVLERVLPVALPLPVLEPAPPGARRRAHLRGAVAGGSLGLLAALASLSVAATSRGLLVAAAFVVTGGLVAGVAWGEAAYRGLGAATSAQGRTLHSRSGAFTRDHEIVPAERLQSAAVEASWFQRRRSLATVRLDLAGGRVAVVDRAHGDARAIVAAGLRT